MSAAYKMFRSLVVHDLGGTGPVLLILHPNGFPARTFIPLAKRWKESFRCFGIDMPGQDEYASADLDIDNMVRSLYLTITKLGFCGCFLFGHSFGGALALFLEARYPGTVRAIFSYEPVCATKEGQELIKNRSRAKDLASFARQRKRQFASHDEVITRFKDKAPFKTLHPEAFDAYVKYGFKDNPGGKGVLLAIDADAEAIIFQNFHPFALVEPEKVHCPVSVAIGGRENVEDDVHSLLCTTGPLVADALPNGRLIRFQHLDHLGPFVDPDAVSKAVIDFFYNIPPAKMAKL